VPHLVRSGRSKADLRLGRVYAESRTAPAELPYHVVPRRRGRPNLAEPPRKDGECAGRHVTVLDRSHHVLDRPDLGRRESMG